MRALRWTNLTVRFLLELCLLAAVATAGWHVAAGGVAGAVLAAIAAGLLAAVWGLAIAPHARKRLPDPARLVLELVVFLVAGVALGAAGRNGLGAALAIVAALNAVAVRMLGGEPAPTIH